LFMVWSSIFLGYFVEHIDYLGGTFGFAINQWLRLTVGSFGSFIAIVALLWVVLVILFNADIAAWLNRAKGAKESFFEDDPAPNRMTDIHVVNTIREDQIRADEDAAEVAFDEEEEDDESYGDGEDDSFIVIQSGAEKVAEPDPESYQDVQE